MNVTNHWIKDYLDYGQNKGIFERGATGLELVRKDGSVLPLPNVPFPDFSVVTNLGSATSIGGAYMITATHNKKYGPWHDSVAKPSFGKTTYQTLDSKPEDHVESGKDFSVVRLNKFVVETTGVPHGIDTSLTEQQFIDRYGVMYDGRKQVVAYRAGSGVLNVTYNYGRINYIDVSYKPELLGGSLFTYLRGYKSNLIGFKNFTSFVNELTTGDSGSGLLVWDNQNEEWVLAGALNGSASGSVSGFFFQYATWDQNAVNTLKDRFTHKIALNKGSLTFDPQDTYQYTIDGGLATKYADRKDLSFTGGGEINLSRNLHLGIGGLIFDSGTSYTVNGNTYSYKGAGVDIGKDTTVYWNIKGDGSDDLHKIGEGTLDVKIAQGNKLKVGNGTVLLRAEKTFENIYMANGKATVKLEHADALNKGEKMTGIYFARYGGTLDLNGYSQTFQRIGASDDGAIITNTAAQTANINFALPKWAYAYHGQFKGNVNVNHKFTDEVSNDTKHKERHLIFDGGMEILGDVAVENAKLTMQGLPVTHATFGQSKCGNPPVFPCRRDYVADFYNKELGANNKNNSIYKSQNQKNSFDQPDWKHRTYILSRLALDKAVFGLGRESSLYTNIDAKNSTVTFGGDTIIYRDDNAGDNVTGFDFQQKLNEGKSNLNDTIYFEGDIKASQSTFTSHIPVMAASFELNDNSKFTAVDKSSVTRILDKGIKVNGKSSLELGNIVVQNTNQPVSITKSSDSTVSVENVEVKAASLQLPGEVVNGHLKAYQDGNIYTDTWKLKDGNLISEGNGKIHLQTLESAGQQVADANITISDKLAMSDLNPNEAGLNNGEWIGLNVGKTLTLESDAEVSASLSNDYLSLKNIRFNSQHTLVKALTLDDQRKNKEIIISLQGNAVDVTTEIKDNTILFSFGSKPENGPGLGGGENNSPVDELLNTPVGNAFLDQNKIPNAKDLLVSILQHNSKGGLTFQEVAIEDALSMSDTQAGVEALNNIIFRTNKMFDQAARTIKKESFLRPIHNILDSRLAVLRRSARTSINAYHPVASLTYDKDTGKKKFEKFLHQSLYADVAVGYEQDGNMKENVVSTSVGYDNIWHIDNSRLVLGGAFSMTKLHRNEDDAKDDAMMYSLTGYLSFEQKEGLELQSYLTAGYLNNDRSFTPEIFLGEQKFDEDSWMLMSSNYFKYHFRKGPISIRPMILMDIGFTHTSSSESDYLKRDAINDASLDLGMGIEFEGTKDDMGYLFQFTAKRNVLSSADKVGLNLRNAASYISYALEDRDDVTFSGNLMISKRLKHDVTVDVGAGMSASTGGAVGVNANARVRWLF